MVRHDGQEVSSTGRNNVFEPNAQAHQASKKLPDRTRPPRLLCNVIKATGRNIVFVCVSYFFYNGCIKSYCSLLLYLNMYCML